MHCRTIVAAFALGSLPFSALAQRAPANATAASNADADAVCFLAVTYIARLADRLDGDQRRQGQLFRDAVPFYGALLANRYSDAQLPQVIGNARTVFETGPRAETAGACVGTMARAMRRVSSASRAAERPKAD